MVEKRSIPILPPEPIFTPDNIRHAVPLSRPSHDPDAQPSRCLHINLDYFPALIQLVDYYCYPDAWGGDDQERELAAARMVNLQILLMTSNLSCGGEPGMEFRQNSNDPCLMEYSTDGGASWKTMFNYRLCFQAHEDENDPPSAAAQVDITLHNNVVVNTYDGTIQSVAPEMVHDSTPTDDFRDAAICAVISQIMYGVQSIAINTEAEFSGFAWDVARWLGKLTRSATSAVYWLGSAGGAATFGEQVLLLAAIALQKDNADSMEEWDITPLREEPLILSLICYAYGQVQGDTVSFAQWSSMFNGSDSLENMNADCYQFITALFANEDGYAGFIESVNDLVADLENEVATYSCPCAEFEHVFDFTADDGGWVVEDYAEYVAGVGWRSVACLANSKCLSIRRDANPRIIYEIEVIWASGLVAGSGVRRITRYPDVTHFQLERGIGSFDETDDNQSDVDGIGVWADSSTATANTLIESVIVRGYGTDPYI